MPEATIICCDCSEYMRNGDFNPSRFASQSDAVSLISNAKTQQNHENTVGLIAMHPNQKADVLVNCTQDLGRVLSSLAKMKIGDNSLIKPPSLSKGRDDAKKSEAASDSINILVALQTAQLALKHRKNKKQDQRIIIFVGSPIARVQTEKTLIKAAKRLKKNNVSVDIVNFGESEENTPLLEKFVDTVKANDNSNLVTVEPGKLLSDVLVATPIFRQGGAQINEFGGLGGGDADLQAALRASQGDVGGGAAASGAAPFGGVDPNTDPELAMALRMSMEEERQRQEAEAKRAADDGAASGSAASASNASGDSGAAAASGAVAAEEAKSGGDVGDLAEALDIDENDEELLKALQMSMEEEDGGGDGDVEMGGDTDIRDGQFVDELLDGLPGIDPHDMAEIANMDDLLDAVDDENDDDDAAQSKGDGKEKEKK